MVKQYDLGTGVNPARHRKRIKAQTVAKYKLHDAIAMLNSVMCTLNMDPEADVSARGRLCVVDLPTQVQATFLVKMWLEKGQ